MGRNGRFVLAGPGSRPSPSTATPRAAVPHHLEIRGPLDGASHREPYPTPEEAPPAYERIIAGDPVTPLRSSGVWKIRLVLDDAPVEERLVVRTLPRVV